VRQNQERNRGVAIHERAAVLGEKTEISFANLLLFNRNTERKRVSDSAENINRKPERASRLFLLSMLLAK
jgi:hypothetical protein